MFVKTIYSYRIIILLVTLFTTISSVQFCKASETGSDKANELSLEALFNLDIEVAVASLFLEDELLVGSTVSNITEKDWNRRGAKTLMHALESESSIVSYHSLNGSWATAIRGYASSLSVRGLAISLDGVPLNTSRFATAAYHTKQFQLGILDRIELIKGPGSAIYGSDAFHGVIAMKSFESDEDHYSVDVSCAGPKFYGDGKVKISHGLGDKIRLNFAAAYNNQADQEIDYEYDASNPDHGDGIYKNEYNNATSTFKLNFHPTKSLQIKFGMYLNDAQEEGFPGVNIDSIGLDADEGSWNDWYIGRGSVTYTFDNDISIEANGYYWQNDEFSVGNMYNSGVGENFLYRNYEESSCYGGAFIVKQPDNLFNVQWIIAYSYKKSMLNELTVTLTGEESGYYSEMDTSGHNMGNDTAQVINSGFTQLKWGAIENKLFLLAGCRYDFYSDPDDFVEYGGQTTPRLGLIFMPEETASIKALYGRAFRAPCPGELYGTITQLPNPEISPETIDTYELVYMKKMETYKFNITGFFSSLNDGIIAITEGGSPIYKNFGKNRAYGLELSGLFSIKPFVFDLSFSYVKSESIDDKDINDPNRTVDLEFNVYPKYQILSGVQYNLMPYDINFYLKNTLYFDWKEQETTQINPDQSDLKNFWRVDLDISKMITDKLEMSLGFRNLLNAENYRPNLWGSYPGPAFPIEEPGFNARFRVKYIL